MNIELLKKAGKTGSKEEAIKVLVEGGYPEADARETAGIMFDDGKREAEEKERHEAFLERRAAKEAGGF